MTPSLEGFPTKAKEAPSSHEVRLALLDTNPVFQCREGRDTIYQISYHEYAKVFEEQKKCLRNQISAKWGFGCSKNAI